MKNKKRGVLVVFLMLVMCVSIMFGRAIIEKNVFAKTETETNSATVETIENNKNENNASSSKTEVIEKSANDSTTQNEILDKTIENTNASETTKVSGLQNARVVIRGKAKKEYEAEKATISFMVNSLDLDKKVSRDKNKEITNKIVSGLAELGIGKDMISYSYSSCYLTREGFKNNLTGTRTSTTLSVQVDNLENLMSAINSITENGGEVNSINFKLNDFESKYNEVLNLAINSAKLKADEVLGTTGTIKGIKEEYIYSCDTKYQSYIDGLDGEFLNNKITVEAQVEIVVG